MHFTPSRITSKAAVGVALTAAAGLAIAGCSSSSEPSSSPSASVPPPAPTTSTSAPSPSQSSSAGDTQTYKLTAESKAAIAGGAKFAVTSGTLSVTGRSGTANTVSAEAKNSSASTSNPGFKLTLTAGDDGVVTGGTFVGDNSNGSTQTWTIAPGGSIEAGSSGMSVSVGTQTPLKITDPAGSVKASTLTFTLVGS